MAAVTQLTRNQELKPFEFFATPGKVGKEAKSPSDGCNIDRTPNREIGVRVCAVLHPCHFIPTPSAK